ncbi:MAG TPA: hypothetical protein VND93_30855 [Myxococcales bacterium]|nr:hypothetical protein [Myxococcales bacterium]
MRTHRLIAASGALFLAAASGAWAGTPEDRRPGDLATLRMDQRITYPGEPRRVPWSSGDAAAHVDRARDPCPCRGPASTPPAARPAQARHKPSR